MRAIMMRVAVALLALGCARAAAENATIPGEVSTPHPTLIHLAIEWKIQGDDNLDGVVAVRYRTLGAQAWREAMPLRRVPAGRSRETSPTFTWQNKHSGSLFDLRPNTTYEVHLQLTDPDGGSTEKTVRARTRPVPSSGRAARGRTIHVAQGSAGGDGSPERPFGSLQDVQALVAPGDLVLIHPGIYREGLLIKRSGTAERPIVYRGTGDGEAILVGWNRSSPYPRHVIVNAHGAQYVHLEGLTIGAPGLPDELPPGGILADYVGKTIESRRVGIKANGAKGLVVRRCTIRAVYGFVAYKPGATDCYIADNVIEGTTRWVSEAMGAHGKNIGEGIEVTGPGNVICFNRVTGFRDCISTLEGSGVRDQYCIDIYNNDVYIGADDGIEADFCFHNCRILRNRLTNCFVGLSSQPGLGGPTYFIRNVMYNLTHVAFKLHRYSQGDVILHNTVVKIGDGMGCYAAQPFDFAFFRNNLCIGGAGETKWGGFRAGSGMACRLKAHGPHSSFDYDAVGTHQTAFRARIGRRSFSQVEPHGLRIDMSVFDNVAFPSRPVPGYEPPDLRPRAGAKVVDAAVRLPNVNDRFRGRAPDIGAYEAGQTLPLYGPRPPGVDEETAFLRRELARSGKKKRAPKVALARQPAGPDPQKLAAARAAVAAVAQSAQGIFRERIIAGVQAGRRVRVYVDVGGAAMRGIIQSADAERLVVRVPAGEIPIPWNSFAPRRFAAIAAKYAGDDAVRRVQLAALYAAAGQVRRAIELLDGAEVLDESWKRAARQMRLLARSRP